jgi:hypothetical protein
VKDIHRKYFLSIKFLYGNYTQNENIFLTSPFYFGICPSGNSSIDCVTLFKIDKTLTMSAFHDRLQGTRPKTD